MSSLAIVDQVRAEVTPVLELLDTPCEEHDGADCGACAALRGELVTWLQKHGAVVVPGRPFLRVSRRKVQRRKAVPV